MDLTTHAIGSLTARDLPDLINRALPELYTLIKAPAAIVAFGIAVDPAAFRAIADLVEAGMQNGA